jgi:hypothetical protein
MLSARYSVLSLVLTMSPVHMAERPFPPSLLPVRFRTSNEDRTFDNTCNTEDYRKRTNYVSNEKISAEEAYKIVVRY